GCRDHPAPDLCQINEKEPAMNTILPSLVLIPLFGAACGAFVPRASAKMWALLVTLIAFAVSLAAAFQFDFSAGAMQFNVAGPAVTSIGFQVSMGIDSISLWLVLLTTLLAPLSIAASFASIREREKEYYAWMLVLLSAMIGVFVSRDLLLFYTFF